MADKKLDQVFDNSDVHSFICKVTHNFSLLAAGMSSLWIKQTSDGRKQVFTKFIKSSASPSFAFTFKIPEVSNSVLAISDSTAGPSRF